MKQNKIKTDRGLVLPKNFIESYLTDLTEEEKLGIMDAVFTWYTTEKIPTIENKLVRVLFNNLLGFLKVSKKSYEDGSLGGAPIGNQNAKKKTTPVDLVNNPPCITEQPTLKNETTLREEKLREEKLREEKLRETRIENNRNEINVFDLDMFSNEAQKEADKFLQSKGW